MPAKPTFALRDWNTGHLAGQKVTDVLPELHHYIDNPDQAVPGGEPLNNYISRLLPFVKQLVEDSRTHLAVGHARGTQVLHALSATNGRSLDPQILKAKPVVDPGQALVIGSDWTMIPDHKEGK